MTPRRVIVVGAGAAGLAAAVTLRDRGCAVVVLESDVPGGKARTIEVQPGWWIEWGPHSLTSRAASVFALADRLGVPATPARPEARRRFIVRDRRLLAVPGGLSWAEWRDVACGLARAVDDPPGATLRAWVTGRFGPRIGGDVLDAAANGIWASSPDEIEAESAFPWLVDALRAARRPLALPRGGGGRRGTWSLAGGLGALTDAARALLGEAIVKERATSIRRSGGAWAVETDGGERDADAVVLATDAADAAPLLRAAAPEAADHAAAVRYAPLAVLHALCARAALPAGFGFLAPPREDLGLLGAICVSSMLEGRAPPGRTSLAVMFGGGRAPADLDLDDDALVDRLRAAHRRLTGAEIDVVARQVVRHPRAVAVPGPGHRARVAAAARALPAGLALAGAWCGAGAMEDAVRSGITAAERVAG